MNLIVKIFGSFLILVIMAAIIGFIGLKTVNRMDNDMAETVEYEVEAGGNYSRITAVFQAAAVAERTLLNLGLDAGVREEQHRQAARRKKEIADLVAAQDALLNRGLANVTGWNDLLRHWQKASGDINKWLAGLDEMLRRTRAWEATFVLNPDALISNIMRYRGDHYALATRLGEMIAQGKSIGPEIPPDDTLCNFGKWRVDFDSGKVEFSRNAAIRDVMQAISDPHRRFHQAASRAQGLIAQGADAFAISAAYRESIASAGEVIKNFDSIAAEAENSRKLLGDALSYSLGELMNLRSAALADLEALIRENGKNMDNNMAVTMANGKSGVRRMEGLSIAAVAIGLGMMLILHLTLSRRMTRPLLRVIDTLNSDANRVAGEAAGVAANSVSLSEGAARQASALEETSSAIEEITAMARKNLDNTKSANSVMQENARQISESAEAVNRMSAAMREIKDSSSKIGTILKTIEDIAFQTNLLALNAAVEAARAGEAGKGFAVVADEVRNLAQRSAQAVKDTSGLIGGTVDRVNNGASITTEIETHFESISGSTEKIRRMIEEIDGATNEQTLGLEQINTSVGQIDRVNQENAGYAESNASASGSLNSSSTNMMGAVEDLGGVLTNILGKRKMTPRGAAAPAGNALPVTAVAPRAALDGARQMKALPAPRRG